MAAVIASSEPDACARDLEPALAENLIIALDGQRFKFAHDKIQKAVYAAMDGDEKQNLHVRIGRLLRQTLSTKELKKHIFDVVNQFNQGLDLVQQPEEKKQLCELNHRAGLKAKQSSAYWQALAYLSKARDLLEANTWQTNCCPPLSHPCPKSIAWPWRAVIWNTLLTPSSMNPWNFTPTDRWANFKKG